MTALGVDPGQALFLSEQDLAAQNEAKLRLYASVTASVPGAEYRVLDSGGHSSIQTDRPDDIARSIRDLLQEIDLA